MNLSIRVSILGAATLLAVSGQDFDRAIQTSKADLDKALAEFSELQQLIAREKEIGRASCRERV